MRRFAFIYSTLVLTLGRSVFDKKIFHGFEECGDSVVCCIVDNGLEDIISISACILRISVEQGPFRETFFAFLLVV